MDNDHIKNISNLIPAPSPGWPESKNVVQFIPKNLLPVPFCCHLRVSPTRKSRQLHPKNGLDNFLFRSHASKIIYRYLSLSSNCQDLSPVSFLHIHWERSIVVLSFLTRGNSCVSASHTSGSHVWRDCQFNASLARIKQDEQGWFPFMETFNRICNIELL